MRIEEWKIRIPDHMRNLTFEESVHKYVWVDDKESEYNKRPDYLEMESWSRLVTLFFDEFDWSSVDQKGHAMELSFDNLGVRRKEEMTTW